MSSETPVLERAYAFLVGLLMLALFGVVIFVLIARNVFSAPFFWSEEVTRVVFLWGVFLGLPLAVWRGQNMKADILAGRFAPTTQFVVDMVMHLLVLAFLAVIFRLSLPLVELAMRGRMLTTGWSNAVLRLPLTVGVALAFAAQLFEIVKSVRLWQSHR